MRKLIIVALCCTALLLSGYAGYRGYKVWKQKHLMSMAHDFESKADARNALLCLSQVLAMNPVHPEATRMMADFCEAVRSPNALIYRQRLLDINPSSLQDRLALVRTALNFGDRAVATNTLNGVNAEGRKTAEYHSIASAVALSTGQYAEAEKHMQEVIRLEPFNPTPQLNLAVLHLHETNAETVAEARAVLNVLSLNPTNANLRCLAIRELVGDALATRQNETALSLSKKLLDQTNSVYKDRLLRLEVLLSSKSPDLKPTLAAYQKDASTNIAKIHDLASWQMSRVSPADTLAWFNAMPPAMQTNQSLALLSAECRDNLRDWQGLESFLAKQNWGDMDFVRSAFRTRALRGMEMGSAAKLEWDKAVNGASAGKPTLIALLRLASQWQWASEVEDLLGRIVDKYPSEEWASRALMQTSLANGQTRTLMALLAKNLKKSPNDFDTKNNLAMIALLLEASELKPHDMAREVYNHSTTNSSYASTYALSLFLQGKNADALKVMEQLKPKDLEEPSVAGYYGIILKANGNKVKAKRYLDLTAKTRFLPEEKKLMDRARQGL